MEKSSSSDGLKLWFSVCRNSLSKWYEADGGKGKGSVVEVEAKAESGDLLPKKKESGDLRSVSGPTSQANFVSYAAVGPTIYVLGGVVFRPGRPVGCTDGYGYSTVSPQRGWFQLPPMLVGRSRPLTAVLDGKLYVFGGLNMSSPEPWAEVFDPKSGKSGEWSPLPTVDLLCASARSAVAAVASPGQKIILLLNPRNRMIYLFSAKSNSWKLFDDVPVDVYFPCKQPVMVDDEIMYYCTGQHLHAYHIYSRGCLSTKIDGLDMDLDFEEEDVIRSQSLIHLGGSTFYLVWLHEHSVRCTRFWASVDKCSDDGKATLIVSVESKESYLVGNNDEDLEFGGALLLDHGWRSEGTSEIIPTGDEPHTEGSQVEGN